MICSLCDIEIPTGRLKALPDTELCVQCSQEIGSDYEVRIIEENLGGSIVSKPMIHRSKRHIIKNAR